MKQILSILAVVAFVFSAACAQESNRGFTIKGSFGFSPETDSIHIFNEQEEKIAGAPIINNEFEIKGSVNEPCYATLGIQLEGELVSFGNLILDNENFTYVSERMYEQKIKGGKIHDMVLSFANEDAYIKASNEYAEMESDIIGRSMGMAGDNGYSEGYDGEEMETSSTQTGISEEDEKRLNAKFAEVLALEDKALLPIIENPGAPVIAKVFALSRLQNTEKYTFEKRIELLEGYKKQLEKPLSSIEWLIESYQNVGDAQGNREIMDEGVPYKEVVAKDAEGNTVKLSDVVANNKYTLVEFWASWCGPCRKGFPFMKKIYEKYKPKGLEIYAIALDSKQEEWMQALKVEKTPWINVLGGDFFNCQSAKDYGITGVPTLFLIDREGTIIMSKNETGEPDADSELDRMLGELMP